MAAPEEAPEGHPSHERQRGSALSVLPLIAAVVAGLALIGVMLAMMAWWGGGNMGGMGMMQQGRSGADQTPVVSDAQQVTVEMRDFEFSPAKLTVDAGTELTWVNRGSVPHNAIAGDGAFDSGTMSGGDSWSVVLDEPGAYPYVCTFHPGMDATLTVQSRLTPEA